MHSQYDLLIRNATIVDGTGATPFVGDLAVVSDRIVEIGSLPPTLQAERILNAEGLVVAPGFIDIHTHADISLLVRPQHLPKIMQGVTTEVFTNCGLGFAPITDEGMTIQRTYLSGLFGNHVSDADGFEVDWAWRSVADFLARFESRGLGTNIAYLIPHGAVRVSVMGMAERAADAGERQAMEAMVADGLAEGAWGLSTGLWYAPMRAADAAENVAMCRAATFFATHQRDYGSAIFQATEESLQIAEEAGVPVQISHLQMNGAANKGRADALLQVLEQAQKRGVDVTCDTYPYTAGSTLIQTLLPSWAVDGGPDAIFRRLHDAEIRAQMVDYLRMLPTLPGSTTDWNQYRLVGAQSNANRNLEGLSFTEAAAARNLTPAEWICAVLEEEELRACYVHHAAHEDNVRTILQWSGQMVGSDGLHLPGKTHPRLYGTFPRVLGKYVREEKVISLESAIAKMTSIPAKRLGLKERGLLAKGFYADFVVFDPQSIGDTATFEAPLQFPIGIPYVFVNGVAVKDDSNATYALPGRVLRR